MDKLYHRIFEMVLRWSSIASPLAASSLIARQAASDVNKRKIWLVLIDDMRLQVGDVKKCEKTGVYKVTMRCSVTLGDDLTSIRTGTMPLDSSLSNKTAIEKLKLTRLTNQFTFKNNTFRGLLHSLACAKIFSYKSSQLIQTNS